MKLQDLRIGVAVLDVNNNRIVTVHGIGPTWETIHVCYSNGAGVYQLKYDQIKPIPLTEEWLVKFGFTEATDEYGGYLSPEMNGGGRIRVNKNQWYSHVNYVELKHVHQLQNLYYALTQTEL